MSRFYPGAPVLSMGTIGSTSLALSWTDISARGIPINGYQVWRGTGTTPQTFSLVATVGVGVLTYTDNTVVPNTTYVYFVVGQYDTNRWTSWSNYVSATTLALHYVYTMRTGGMDIYDVLNTANPSLAAQLTDSNHNGGGLSAHASFSDPQYLWVNDGTNMFAYSWFGHELNPVLQSTTANWQGIIVRRSLAIRNNLAFRRNSSTNNIESWDISNPASPALINSVASPMIFSLETMAYDAVGSRLVMTFCDHNTTIQTYTFSVASNGTLGIATTLGAAISTSSNADVQNGFVYNGCYYTAVNGTVYVPYKLDGSGATTPTATVSGANLHYGAVRPHIRSHYVFFGASQTGGGNAIRILDLNDGTLKADIGGATLCTGLLTSVNLLVFTTLDHLYTYDLTPLFSSGSAPTLLGSLATTNQPNGLSGYIGDGWDGNNGGCST